MVKKISYLSQSSLKRKVLCSNLNMESKDGVKPKFFTKGSIIHDMLEHMDKEGAFTYSKEYSVYNGEKQYYPHTHTTEDFEEYESIAKQFFTAKSELFQSGEPEVNLKSVFLENEEEQVILAGTIDRLYIHKEEKQAIMVDWKTGQSRYGIVNPDKQKTYLGYILNILQATVYSYLVHKNYPSIEKFKFIWHYIEMDVEVEFNYTIADMEEIYTQLFLLYIISLNEGLRINKSCRYCVNNVKCPLYVQGVDWADNIEKLSPTEVVIYKKKLTNYRATIDSILNKIKVDAPKDILVETQHNYIKIDDSTPREILELLIKNKDRVRVNKKVVNILQDKYKNVVINTETSEKWKPEKRIKNDTSK